MSGNWQRGKFRRANNPDRQVTGRIYRGLALRMVFPASPKGRRPPMWILAHVGTGHSICFFDLQEEAALRFATSIAECGDFEFDGLEGWRNVDPDLPDKVKAVISGYQTANPKAKIRFGGGPQSPEAARAIAEARA